MILMNKNLVDLKIIKNIIYNKGFDEYIKQVGYSSDKNKKYYVILKNGKVVNFGSRSHEDYLIHHDKERQINFKKRFYKLYHKNKNNPESPLFWSYNILW